MTETLISVDIECSGPLVGTHSVLQIGASLIDEPDSTFNAILRPISDAADPDAMKIVGKPLTFFFEQGQEPAIVMSTFKTWAEEQKAGPLVFVGFNAAFDWSFMNWYFLTYVGSNPFGVAPLDIKAYYAGASGVPWDDTRSSRLPDDLKVAITRKHDALADAVGQAEIFRKIRAKYHE